MSIKVSILLIPYSELMDLVILKILINYGKLDILGKNISRVQ